MDLADARHFQSQQSRQQQNRHAGLFLERSTPLVFTTTLLEKRLQPRFRDVGHRTFGLSPRLPPCAFGSDGTVMFASATVMGEGENETTLQLENKPSSANPKTSRETTGTNITAPKIVMITPTTGRWRELVDIFDTHDGGGTLAGRSQS